MSEVPLDQVPGVADAAHDAARGQVVYLTEHGERLAAVVPAEFAAALEGMPPEEARELPCGSSLPVTGATSTSDLALRGEMGLTSSLVEV
jgi:hypothetical protein